MAEYIDREKIIYSKRTMEAWFGCQRDDYSAMVAFKDDIDKIPAADVQPVMRGKWKRRIVDNGFNADWKCSECGYKVMFDFVSFNFCPNCGADMRAEEGE